MAFLAEIRQIKSRLIELMDKLNLDSIPERNPEKRKEIAYQVYECLKNWKYIALTAYWN